MPPSNLEILGRYSARMTAGDYDAVYDTYGIGLSAASSPHVSAAA